MKIEVNFDGQGILLKFESPEEQEKIAKIKKGTVFKVTNVDKKYLALSEVSPKQV